MTDEHQDGAAAEMHIWKGLDDLPLAGDSWGRPYHQTIFLLHGGGQTRHAWKDTGRDLAEAGFFALAYDARGHGDSGWDAQARYHPEYMARDLVRVCEQTKAQRPVLVGASMGGITSLMAVAELGLDAAALVLVDIIPQMTAEGAQEVRDFMKKNLNGFESLEEVGAAVAAYQPHRRRPRNLEGLTKNVRLRADGRYYWHWDPNWLSVFPGILSYRERLEACARSIDIPVLLVRGALSNVVSDQGVRDFLQQCPHAEYRVIDRAAHMVAGDKNDMFTAAILGFLKKSRPRMGEFGGESQGRIR